jgi:hypothetical protein
MFLTNLEVSILYLNPVGHSKAKSMSDIFSLSQDFFILPKQFSSYACQTLLVSGKKVVW